jgi:hypothetical protein
MSRRMRRICIPETKVVLVSIGCARASRCKETTFGKCYTVHGRSAIYADGIWQSARGGLLGANF